MSIIDTENQYRQFYKKFRKEDCIFLPILSDNLPVNIALNPPLIEKAAII